jgi:ABC-type phosphate transport system ATPase subunit
VKLVLAAAMWNNPHLLIMDEPTNYLDRVRWGGFGVLRVEVAGLRLRKRTCARPPARTHAQGLRVCMVCVHGRGHSLAHAPTP